MTRRARPPLAEIKHGRISMMAFLGMMVQELGITFPGSINLDGSVQFPDILKDGMGFPAVANIPTFGLFQIVAFAGFAEIGAMPAAQYTGGPQNPRAATTAPSAPSPAATRSRRRSRTSRAWNRALTSELQNGRAAMLGTFGAMCHSCVDSCDHRFFTRSAG